MRHGEAGLGEALFLRTHTPDITLLSLGQPLELDGATRRKMEAAGIECMDDTVTHVATTDGAKIITLTVDGHGPLAFNTLYSALGCAPRADLARALGAVLDDRSCVMVDAHQRSSITNLFVAGDVAQSLDQISVAMGQAADRYIARKLVRAE